MLRRLEAAIDSGDLKVINMHKEGDRPHVLELFARPVEMVLRDYELIADMRLACHHTLHFTSLRIPTVTGCLLEMQTDLYPFN